jgi:WD40 repeat protein
MKRVLSRNILVSLSMSVLVIAFLTRTSLSQSPQRADVSPLASGHAVAGQGVTLLPDGRWLFTGGTNSTGPQATVTLWQPQTHEITHSSSLRVPRAWHSATVLPDGTVLVFGGLGLDGQVVTESEVFFPATNTVVPFATIGLTPRTHHSATLLTDGSVLLAGGVDHTDAVLNTAELWDFHNPHSPIRIPQLLTTARRDHTAVLLPTGNVLLWGGKDATGTGLKDGESYNPVQRSFTPFAVPDLGLRTPDCFPLLLDAALRHLLPLFRNSVLSPHPSVLPLPLPSRLMARVTCRWTV